MSVCIRCEQDRTGAPWMVFNRSDGSLRAYCPECALAVVEENREQCKEQVRKVSEN